MLCSAHVWIFCTADKHIASPACQGAFEERCISSAVVFCVMILPGYGVPLAPVRFFTHLICFCASVFFFFPPRVWPLRLHILPRQGPAVQLSLSTEPCRVVPLYHVISCWCIRIRVFEELVNFADAFEIKLVSFYSCFLLVAHLFFCLT